MSVFSKCFSVLRTGLRCVAAVCAINLFLGQAQAAAREEADDFSWLEEELQSLSSEQLEELLTFVAGNALFTLYHEAGHMLVSELEIPVLAQEEDAVDNLATVSMLAADTGEWDLLLINAMIGWFLIAEEDYDNLIFYGEHDLDQQRGYRILCLMVGADEETFLDLANDLDLPEDRTETCVFDYDQAAESWELATAAYLRETDGPGGKVNTAYEAAPEGLQTVAMFFKASELMDQVAAEFDTLYDLPEQVTFRAAACDMENAFWDPQTREITICHELLGGFAAIYLQDLLEAE